LAAAPSGTPVAAGLIEHKGMISKQELASADLLVRPAGVRPEDGRPLLSIIAPVYNEAALLERHLRAIVAYLQTLEDEYRWELLVVNDGSRDDSGRIAEAYAARQPGVRVLHHPRNFGLGQAMKFGFANTTGDYVVTLDIDLSYDVHHIGELLEKARASHAKIVLASPYMEGGTIRNVPRLRKMLSIAGNRFLRLFVRGHLSTLTCMVRLYDGPFIRSVNLRAMGMDVMPETLYKGMILRARIEEIPGRLDWGPQLEFGAARSSSMRVLSHVYATIMSGFIFRPFLFFTLPGLLLAAFSAFVNFWMFVHFFEARAELAATQASVTMSQAVGLAYERYPHTFVIGLLSAMLAAQLIGLGILALQNKHYFEELFHLASTRFQALNARGAAQDGGEGETSGPERPAASARPGP
jgi:glycosyltransferase involved in cell wall biosynthesis